MFLSPEIQWFVANFFPHELLLECFLLNKLIHIQNILTDYITKIR